MILFTILAIAIAMMIIFGVIILGAGGAIGMVIFSDVIVCVLLIVLCVKHCKKKK